jgi:chromosome segregation ATPase
MTFESGVVQAVLTLLLGLIAYFLRQKDMEQQKQLTILFQKHDEDAKALADLREKIAREHYVKEELDRRFSELGDKMDRLADKIDGLVAAIMHCQGARPKS